MGVFMWYQKADLTKAGQLIKQKNNIEQNIKYLIQHKKPFKAKLMKIKLTIINQQWKSIVTQLNAMNDSSF